MRVRQVREQRGTDGAPSLQEQTAHRGNSVSFSHTPASVGAGRFLPEKSQVRSLEIPPPQPPLSVRQ